MAKKGTVRVENHTEKPIRIVYSPDLPDLHDRKLVRTKQHVRMVGPGRGRNVPLNVLGIHVDLASSIEEDSE